MAHWADDIADEVLRSGRAPVLSTGISPSGEIHIGNMREVLTADAVYRALRDRGVNAGFNFVCDNFDPLRTVYKFLDRSRYESCVGQPLSDIPCPCGDHASYGDHFLEPFLAALKELHVDVELFRADEMYKSGRMNPYIGAALAGRDRIAAILGEMTGKEVGEDWSPFNPWCPGCRRLTHAKVTGFSVERETVEFECACGERGTLPMAGGGKLIWRIDWPARWMALGVTVEPFGKDHSTRGGSYDTGRRVVKEVFGGEPPYPIPYEWIRLKGLGDMSSSRGNVVPIGAMLEVVPPEVLRYLVMKTRPAKTINFDPGLPLLQLADELETGGGADPRAVELSRAAGFEPLGISYKHLVVVVQAANFDVSKTVEILTRAGQASADADALAARVPYIRNWLERFAPADLRFEVCRELPPAARELAPAQRGFLDRLSRRLEDSMTAEDVHALVYEVGREFPDAKPADLFQAIYLSLLGKPRGPRAGWFITVLGPAFAAERFREAAAA